MCGRSTRSTSSPARHRAVTEPWHAGGVEALQACVLPSVPEEIVTTTLGMLAAQGRISPPLAFTAVLAGLLTVLVRRPSAAS